MSSKNLILLFASILIVIGLFKPDLSKFFNNNVINNNISIVIDEPSDPQLLDECGAVIQALKADSDRKIDGLRLASLYNDMATLISLDKDDMVIKNTEEIRQANKLTGNMLKLDIKGKYPQLSSAAEKLIIASIGDDSVLLDAKLRENAVNAFKALAWACYEGSK